MNELSMREKFLLAGLIAFMIGMVVFGEFYAKQARATAAAQAFADAKQKDIDANNKAISEINQQMKSRDDSFANVTKAYQEEIASIKDENSALKAIKKNAPSVSSAGVVIGVKAEALPASAKQQLPDAPDYAVMTHDAFIANSKLIVQCRLDQAALGKCNLDAGDLHKQLAASEANLKATAQQRDKWEQAAKGGTWAKRAEKTGLLAGCGGLGALIGKKSSGSGAGNDKATVLGAVIGVVGCAILHK